MDSRRETIFRGDAARLLAAGLAACLFLSLGAVSAQQVAQPQQPAEAANPPPPAAPAPPPSHQPGFIDAFGHWLQDGASRFRSGMEDMRERLDRLGGRAREAAKDATGSVTSLPNARVVTGRERCPSAQNGAPDCQTAAHTFCRGKGFAGGKSLDTQSEQKCSARLLLEGRAPNATECPTEVFVTRAMCQ